MVYIGDVDLPLPLSMGLSQGRPTTEFNTTGDVPTIAEFERQLESGDLPFVLHEDTHARQESLEEQVDAIRSFADREAEVNTIDFLDQRGFLSISSVDFARTSQNNIREGTVSFRYLPTTLYKPGISADSEAVSNDYGLRNISTFEVPSSVENVRLRNAQTGDSIPWEPVTSRVDEDGDTQHGGIKSNKGVVQQYSLGYILQSIEADTQSGTTTEVLSAGALSVERLNSSGESISHTFDYPNGEIEILVRAKADTDGDSVTVEGDSLSFDTNFEVKSTTVTVTNSDIKVDVDHESGVVDVDFIAIRPVDTVHLTFDYPGDRVFDMDASGVWRLSEGEGSTAYDSSPNGHHGTVNGATWDTDVPEGIDYSLEFTNDSIDLGYIYSKLDIFTVCGWIKPDKASDRNPILSNENNQSGFTLRTDNSSGVIAIGNGSGYDQATGGSISDETWHFVLATYDGNTLELFVDGNSVATSSSSGISKSSDNLFIGQKGNSNSNAYGNISNVSIYPFVLSQNQIDYLYENPGGSLDELDSFSVDVGQGVRVFDDMGSSNEDNWRRVYDRSHSFNGAPVIENGHQRVVMEDVSDDGMLFVYLWDGSEYVKSGVIRDSGGKSITASSAENITVNSISTTECSVEFEIEGYDGKAIHEIIVDDSSGFKLEFTATDSGSVYWGTGEGVGELDFAYSPSTNIYDANVNEEGFITGDDNYALVMSNNKNFLSCLSIDEESSGGYNFDMDIRYASFGIIGLSEGEEITVYFDHVIPEDANELYVQAETILGAGGSQDSRWDMPLSTSGALSEFSQNTNAFNHDATNGILEHPTGSVEDSISLNAFQWGSSRSPQHYHWVVEVPADDGESQVAEPVWARDSQTSTKDNEYDIYFRPKDGYTELRKFDGGSKTIINNTSITGAVATKFHIEVEWNPGTGDIEAYIWQDGNGKPGSPTVSGTDSAHSSGYVAWKCINNVTLHEFTVHADEVLSSDDSASIVPSEDIVSSTSQNVKNQEVFGYGTFIVFARLKQTSNVQGNISNRNIGEGSNIDMDGSGFKSITPTESYEYIYQTALIDDNEENHDLHIPRIKPGGTGTSHYIVDTFYIIPISQLTHGNTPGPQDLAYQNMELSNSDLELLNRRTL